MTVRYSITVKGKVQGVFYRQSAKKKADELGINGWVKNTPDGGVYIEAEADETVMHLFLKWCHKGPIMAIVQDVNYTTIDTQATHGFNIIEI